MHAVALDFGSDHAGETRAAIQHLRDSGAEKIVLVGSSAGGSATLQLASTEDVDAIVTFSVSGGGDSSISEPGLYVASEGDGDTADNARQLSERFGGKALVVDGDTHGADLMKPHPEVIDQVVAFIQGSDDDDEILDESEDERNLHPLRVGGGAKNHISIAYLVSGMLGSAPVRCSIISSNSSASPARNVGRRQPGSPAVRCATSSETDQP